MVAATPGASRADGDLSAAREAMEAQARAERLAEDVKAAQSRAAKAARPSIIELAKSLLDDLPGLVSDRVQLLALELKRARQALLQMAALVILAAILAATAWITLWCFVVALLLSFGVSLPIALAIVLIINAVSGWLALRRAISLADLLTLPATVRRLTLASGQDSGAAAMSTPVSAGGEAPQQGQS